jgi:hypothetical protein
LEDPSMQVRDLEPLAPVEDNAPPHRH